VLTLSVITYILVVMKRSLADELRQTRPFSCREQEGYLSVLRTAAVLEHAVSEALKPFDLTPTQYNVLRILRGAGEKGLCRNEVGERLVARVPDATRLLDRMEAAGLIRRARSAEDRRFVTTRITGKGLDLLAALDEPSEMLHRSQFERLDEAELTTLIELLERVRGSVGA
jgi:DNA-binding MarR family transcriptional regulator